MCSRRASRRLDLASDGAGRGERVGCVADGPSDDDPARARRRWPRRRSSSASDRPRLHRSTRARPASRASPPVRAPPASAPPRAASTRTRAPPRPTPCARAAPPAWRHRPRRLHRARSRRVERGEHGHRDDLEPRPLLAGSLDRAPQHRPAAAGVDGEHPRAERRGAGDRALDRLGDVVELEIEKDRQPCLLAQRRRRCGPASTKSSSPTLIIPTASRTREHERARPLQRGHIQREDDAGQAHGADCRRSRRAEHADVADVADVRRGRLRGRSRADRRACSCTACRAPPPPAGLAAAASAACRTTPPPPLGVLPFWAICELQRLDASAARRRAAPAALRSRSGSFVFSSCGLEARLLLRRPCPSASCSCAQPGPWRPAASSWTVLDERRRRRCRRRRRTTPPSADEDQREALLVLVLAEGVQLPLVLLARGHLGEASLGLGLGARALDGGLLHRVQSRPGGAAPRRRGAGGRPPRRAGGLLPPPGAGGTPSTRCCSSACARRSASTFSCSSRFCASRRISWMETITEVSCRSAMVLSS